MRRVSRGKRLVLWLFGIRVVRVSPRLTRVSIPARRAAMAEEVVESVRRDLWLSGKSGAVLQVGEREWRMFGPDGVVEVRVAGP